MERVLITADGATATVVTIGAGAGRDAATLLGDLEPTTAAIFCQETVRSVAEEARAAIASTGVEAALMPLPDREAAKSLTVAESAYRWLNSLELARHDLIVAVGGGALTDAAGFIAATYLRGVSATLVPTTLLGAVDASIGGKTAVNISGKNLVGVFRHPARVAVDPTVVAAAPPEVTREGHAEAAKVGFIADGDLMRLYERDGLEADLGEVIRRAVAGKAAIVSEDFRDHGRRAFLNYGHTVGHAVEAVSGLPHGHAVAVGMVAAGRASARALGFRGEERQRALLESLGLPTRVTGVDPSAVEKMLRLDKKRDAEGIRMVLLEDFGRPVLVSVDAATVRAALEAVGLA